MINGIILWILKNLVTVILKDLEPQVGATIAAIFEAIIKFINGSSNPSQAADQVHSHWESFEGATLKSE